MSDGKPTPMSPLNGSSPLELHSLVEKLPRPSDPALSRGLLSGLDYALRLLRRSRLTAREAAEVLTAAIAATKERLAPIEAEEAKAALARAKQEISEEELATFLNLKEEDMVSSEQLFRDLDERFPQDPFYRGEP